MRKRHLFSAGSVVLLMACFSFIGDNSPVMKLDGGPPYNTNAPSEKTCSGSEGTSACHSGGIPDNSGPGTPDILFSGGSVYVPGQTYTVTPTITHPNSNKFGFQIVSLQDNNNLFTGTLTLLDTSRTRSQQPTWGPAQDRIFVMHRIAGTFAQTANLGQWSYEWTAPSGNVGNISFYACFVAANNDGVNNGQDETYYKKITIAPSAVGLQENRPGHIEVYPNPAQNEIMISAPDELGTLGIYDMTGKKMLELFSSSREKKLDISTFPTGVYSLHSNGRKHLFIKQ